MVRQIQCDPRYDLSNIIVKKEVRQSTKLFITKIISSKFLYSLYVKLDAKLNRQALKLWDLIPIENLDSTNIIEVIPLREKFTQRFTPDDVKTIKALGFTVDVVAQEL